MTKIGEYNNLWVLISHLSSKMHGITVKAKSFWQGRWFLSYHKGEWSARYLNIFQRIQRFIFAFDIVKDFFPSLFLKYKDTHKSKIISKIFSERLTSSEILKMQYVARNFGIIPDKSISEKYEYFKDEIEKILKEVSTVEDLWGNFSIFGTLGCCIKGVIGGFCCNEEGPSTPKYTLTSPHMCANWFCFSKTEERYILAVKSEHHLKGLLSDHGAGLCVEIDDDKNDGSILLLKIGNISVIRYNYKSAVSSVVNLIEKIDRERGSGPIVISSQNNFGKGSGLVLCKVLHDAVKRGHVTSREDLYRMVTVWLIEGRLQGGNDFICEKDIFRLVFKCGEHFLKEHYGTSK